MKIITKKKEKEIQRIERENDVLRNGYRAMSLCLDFEKAIIGIMQQLKINEIELPLSYINLTQRLEVRRNPATNNWIVKIKDSD